MYLKIAKNYNNNTDKYSITDTDWVASRQRLVRSWESSSAHIFYVMHIWWKSSDGSWSCMQGLWRRKPPLNVTLIKNSLNQTIWKSFLELLIYLLRLECILDNPEKKCSPSLQTCCNAERRQIFIHLNFNFLDISHLFKNIIKWL